ncbi:AAA family ATPase [Lentzea sp. NPDC058450]|uniref:AAA family ATPase n=1 Tax=Lentzea sp. NPDC058450 TaxID=3346505 RepID=UPI00365F56AD
MDTGKNWRIALVGGPSGVGKSRLSHPLAHRHGAVLVEVDDLVVALQSMTTPEQHPDLHHWLTHPYHSGQSPEFVVERQIALAEALVPALDAVVRNHLDEGDRVVIEGDYVLPSFCARWAGTGEVRGVVVHEPDEAQVLANYLAREPEPGPQAHRAAVSVHHGRWLVEQAGLHGVPVLSARPWSSGADRLDELLGS